MLIAQNVSVSTKRNSKLSKKETDTKFKNYNNFNSHLPTIKTDPDLKTTVPTSESNLESLVPVANGKNKSSAEKVPKPSAPLNVKKTILIGIKPPLPKPATTKTKKTKEDEESKTKEKFEITEISWISSTINSASKLSQYAVIGGYEGIRGSPFWVIRYKIGNQILPGRFDVNKKVAFVANNGKAVRITEGSFGVLCVPPGRVKWVQCSDGTIPEEAIPAGKSEDGEKLYIGRASKNMTIFPGMVHPMKKTCAICAGEKPLEVSTFEILCTQIAENL